MSVEKEGEAEKKAGDEPKKRGRRSIFTDDQRKILLKYYDDGMISTNRQHMDVIESCAKECQTSVERIKRFIGAENYKRKKAQSDDVDETPKLKKQKPPPKLTKKGKEMIDKGEQEDEELDEDD